MDGSLTSGSEFLRDSVRRYFEEEYAKPKIAVETPFGGTVDWSPTLSMNLSHIRVVVEVSEKPYPRIFQMRRERILESDQLVSVFCACPREAYLASTGEAKELINDGYGLLLVSQDGTCERIQNCIPLLLRISKSDFKTEVSELPPVFKRRLQQAFEDYQSNPIAGVSDIAEVFEGMVLKAAKDAARKGYISKGKVKPGDNAIMLDELTNSKEMKPALAAIGGARGFISTVRNPIKHAPATKKVALERSRKTRHQFIDGIRQIVVFRAAMKKRGLTGNMN